MPTNFYMYFVCGLIPMVVGAIYYHPAVMGKAWMNTNGFTTKDLEGGNMALIMGSAYLFCVILAFGLTNWAIHQSGAAGMFMPGLMEAGSADYKAFADLMATHGERYRTFSHGALHGGFAAVVFALPLIAINANFERRGWKYTMIHFFYWFISLILVCGTLCATLEWTL